MLARVLAMALCLSVTSLCSIKRMNGLIWFWGMEAFLVLSTPRFKEIQVSTEISVLPSGTFSQTPDLETVATAYRSSKRVINLARDRLRRSDRDKLDSRRSTKLTVPTSSDARPLQFIAQIVKLGLQRDFVAPVN